MSTDKGKISQKEKNTPLPPGDPSSLTDSRSKIAKLKDSPYTYCCFMETSGSEQESWYTFIRYQNNEEALKHLQKQLETVDWYILDDLSTFDLELDFLVSELTAKEMTKVDLNHTSFHRKFDGKMKKVDLKFKDNYKNEKKISKAYDILGYGQIENYLEDEDIDPEDMVGSDEESENSSSSEENSSSSEEEEENEKHENKVERHSENRKEKEIQKKLGKLPEAIARKTNEKALELPRFAKTKAKRK